MPRRRKSRIFPGGLEFFSRPHTAFSLVEILIVIGVISILSALIISAVSNATGDSSRVIARQQQAAVQQALNNWVVFHSTSGSGIASTRTAYNNANTSLAKLALISDYLDPQSYAHFIENSTNSAQIESEALKRIGSHLAFSSWQSGDYPKVNIAP